MNNIKVLKTLSFVIILLTITTTSIGLFYNNDGEPFYAQNVFGEKVKLFGSGLYKLESYFKAPILIGTDTLMLFITVPIFFLLTIKLKNNSYVLKLLHLSFIVCLLYYSLGLSLGVTLNFLCPIYILLTSVCLISLILGISSINLHNLSCNINKAMPNKGIGIFLIIAGASVFVWFMDIISFIKSGTIPASLGMHTNEFTYVIDIGFIAPAAFIAGYCMLKRRPLGYLLSPLLLVLNGIIGVIVVFQSIFQNIYGIQLPIQAQIVYVGIFVIMSLFAILFSYKFFKNIL